MHVDIFMEVPSNLLFLECGALRLQLLYIRMHANTCTALCMHRKHTYFVTTCYPPRLPTKHYPLMQHYQTLAWTCFSMLCQTIEKACCAEPCACNSSAQASFHRIQQYGILCCSNCKFEHHAEPFACIGSWFSGRALRLQIHLFLVCVDARLA